MQLHEGEEAGIPSLQQLGVLAQGPMHQPGYRYPRETLRPSRVVWAKVEGHDWWPAKVVRRRAVPREVSMANMLGCQVAAWRL